MKSPNSSSLVPSTMVRPCDSAILSCLRHSFRDPRSQFFERAGQVEDDGLFRGSVGRADEPFVGEERRQLTGVFLE